MTPIFLQDALVEELQDLFQDFRSQAPDGTRRPLNVFAQYLPKREHSIDQRVTQGRPGPAQKRPADPRFPYICVDLTSGEIPEGRNADHTRSTVLVIGTYHNGCDRQGARDVFNIIDRIYDRYSRMPVMGKKYVLKFPIRWYLQEDEPYEYFFGGMELDWLVPAIRREIPYT